MGAAARVWVASSPGWLAGRGLGLTNGRGHGVQELVLGEAGEDAALADARVPDQQNLCAARTAFRMGPEGRGVLSQPGSKGPP